MSFMNAMQNTLNDEFNASISENGAIGYRTSGKELLDLNFAVASLRGASEQEIIDKFTKAFFEDKILAMKWLFFARDVRGGLGERRLFRVILKNLVENNPEMIIPVINLIPEYGRYDDLWCLLDNQESAKVVYNIVDEQLIEDLHNMKKNKPISLLAKWMPSINASSAQTKKYAKQFCKVFGLTEREYRQILSRLRKYLDVVETKMSAKNWSEIRYEAVPSKANLIYSNAFLKKDEERRKEYLEKLKKGEAKINASTLYPHDIVHKYSGGYCRLGNKDTTIEALWKALPDTVQGCGNTIVVADGSYSMTDNIGGNTTVTALDVANALAIYFAEHSSGKFNDKYITFSERPQLVDFSKADSLHDKLQIALTYDECANTNIEKVFDLILTTAIKHNMRQEDMPKNVLIISDMEFDSCATSGDSNMWRRNRPNQRLFEIIAQRYADAGYQLPRLVFWNVNSRTDTIPVKENELGVALVSGFSVNIVKMVMSNKLDPYECLLETLNSERYAPIEKALRG